MTRVLLALILVFPGVSARADDLAKITHAKSALELELGLVEQAELSAKRDRCKWELAGADLPRACFEGARLESRLKIAATIAEPHHLAWLTKICVKRARAAARVKSLVETTSLPETCRIEAERRLDDLRYRMEEEHPDELFDSRLNGTR